MKMDKTLELYLERIEKYLKPLAASERVDIVQEIKSEMWELQAKGCTVQEILDRLGPAKDLARSYLGDMITRGSALSWSRMAALCSFYSLAGLTGMVVIPCLGIIAPTFMLCGIACPLVGVLKLLDVLLGLHLPFMQNVGIILQDGMVLNPFLEFGGCALLGIALFLGGWACWKLLLLYIKVVSRTGRTLSL